MLDQDFCRHLEYELSKALENSNKEKLNGFWCDGVLIDESSAFHSYDASSRKKINDTRKVTGTVFMGQDGQGKYELSLHFGKHSLRSYAIGTRLEDCVPSSESDDWFLIDIENKKLEIQLK